MGEELFFSAFVFEGNVEINLFASFNAGLVSNKACLGDDCVFTSYFLEGDSGRRGDFGLRREG